MKPSMLALLLFGGGALGASAAGTIYAVNYTNATAWNLDWNDTTKYSPNTGYPNAPGDQLVTTIGNGGTYMPNVYILNGNKTIAALKKTLQYGKDTSIRPGTPTTSTLTWDTGVAGESAQFVAYGAGGGTGNGDLRCATFVNMVLNSDLLWQGSSSRRYASSTPAGTQGNGQLWGDISGAGKLSVQWNACKSNLETGTAGPCNMAIEGGSTGNTHVGGTEFDLFVKQWGNPLKASVRAGFNLNKTTATGMGNTVVNPKSEIYIATVTDQNVIHDTTSLYLKSNGTDYGTVELNNTSPEQVAGIYFDGTLQAAGTWGSGTSTADNKNDTWFKGSGVLNVVYAPELAVLQPSGAQVVDDVSSVKVPDTAPGGSLVQTFTVKNIGTSTLTLTSVTMDGADTADFTLGTPGSLVLTTGTSTTFDLTFNPTALGVKNVAIHIVSDDADEAAFDFSVTGTCAYPPTYIWKGANNGAWNTAGNWDNSVPTIGKVAVLSDASAGATIDIDTPSATAGGLLFNNNVADQAIGSTGNFPLILNNDIAIAPITVTGSHTVSTGIQAPRGIAVTSPGPAGVLTVSGTSTAVGSSAAASAVVMDVYGAGTEVILSGNVTLTNARSSHVVGNGKLTITGTYATNGSDQIIGSADHGGGTGEVVLSGTGSWTHTGAGRFMVGSGGLSNIGTLTINDNAVLNLGTESLNIGMGGAADSTGVVNQNGGTVTNASTWGTSFGQDIVGNNFATYNLNGGVHETLQIWGDSKGTNVLNFNGGTLLALSGLYPTAFITGLTHAYVQDNGAIINTNSFSVALDQALEHGTGAAIDGGLTKKGAGTLSLPLANSYTGNTTVEDGVLSVTSPNFADTSTITIGTVPASPAVLNLPTSGTDTVAALIIDGGSPAATGKWGRINAIAELGANFETDAITGDGLLDVLPGTATPYQTWIAGPSGYFQNETNEAIIGLDADPDGDGQSNAMEFALGGVPNSNSNNAKIFGLAADSNDADAIAEWLMTIAVRSGTPEFTDVAAPGATMDGVTYTVQGSTTLGSFTAPVQRLTAVVTPPAPNATPPAGYEYRTFRLVGSDGLPAKGFLRVEITH